MQQKSPLYRPANNYNTEENKPAQPLLEAGSANIFLPLRLFLGISFLAAGFDKLFDPQFFDSKAAGYIGNQLAGFAGQSPLGPFLTQVAVPQAAIFGGLVLLGELAIGLGTLLGLYSRTAAFFGFLLSITLWLTASWQVTPFFLGSDLPYAMGWLTLFLAGPHPILSLDAQIKKRKSVTAPVTPLPLELQPHPDQHGMVASGPVTLYPDAFEAAEQTRLARRRFITVAGGTILAGALTGGAWLHSLNAKVPGQSAGANPSAPAGTTPASQPDQTAPTTTANPAPATKAAPTVTPAAQPAIKGTVIGKLAAIPVGNALAFKTPDSGESAYLVHARDGSVKAFSRICTHQGCEVSFIQANQIFACPCHGSQFDANTGTVLRSPARLPLPGFSVQVDASGNIIYTA